ncbi:rCG22204 [Rattus norvegicus]|uniref:RCG22204 n=1 Tax=Rattus norvegicus TaxID=10116 RepID=A6IP24_RAT|nr:rCG22204 [Rattus norvegicus]
MDKARAADGKEPVKDGLLLPPLVQDVELLVSPAPRLPGCSILPTMMTMCGTSETVCLCRLLNDTHGGNRGKGFLGFNTTQFKIK